MSKRKSAKKDVVEEESAENSNNRRSTRKRGLPLEEPPATPKRSLSTRKIRKPDTTENSQQAKDTVQNNKDTKRSNVGRKRGMQPVQTKEELIQEPSRLFLHSDKELEKLFKEFWKDGPYPCIALHKKCESLQTIAKAIEHNKKCIVPMYASFEGRLDEFHALSKEEGICIVCEKSYQYPNAFLYHIERCGITDKKKIPWKCWRCGFEGTQTESKEHLTACTEAAHEAELQNIIENEPRTEIRDGQPHVFGALDDVNLRSGRAVEKFDCNEMQIPKLDAQEAVEKLMALGGSKSARRRINLKPSISSGILPPRSSRVTISNTGQPKYKFRRTGTLSVVADYDGWENYKSQVKKSFDQWNEENNYLLPDCFANAKQEFGPLQDLRSEQIDKTSTSFHFRDQVGSCLSLDSFPHDVKVLKLFESVSHSIDEESLGNWITTSYVGGPINNLKFAPNPLSDNEEVLMVTCYPDDANLLINDWKKSQGQIQFWILKHGKENQNQCEITPWFVLETIYGTIISATWLDVPRPENDSELIGYVAIGTVQGFVAIYRIVKSCLPRPNDFKTLMIMPEPLFVLRQATAEAKMPDNEGEENGNDAESTKTEEELFSPIVKVDWCPYENCRYLAGVTATGAVVIWDFTADLSNPKFLRDVEWSSPATDICFSKELGLIVAFREKIVKAYDFESWGLLLEDNSPRTSGARVISCPRSFNGFMTFQSEYFGNSTVPTTGISYICSDERTRGYFVVPLGNRHDLQMWDASIHPSNGILATAGVDGQLLLSANGRVVPRSSKCDADFSIVKDSLLISQHRLAEKNEENGKKDCLFNYSDICKKTWLEISLKPSKTGRVVQFTSTELRTQSLNVVTTNYFSKSPVVVTGGQAGLLFIRPCRLDIGSSTLDPAELINSLTSNRLANLKKKKQPKNDEES